MYRKAAEKAELQKVEMSEGRGGKESGENGELWKAKHNLRRMLMNKKLLGGVVPPTSTATPTSKNKKKLFVGAVLHTSTATPTEREKNLVIG